MRIGEDFARKAMRLVLGGDKFVPKFGFKQTGDNEYQCYMDSYTITVTEYDGKAMLFARFNSTGELSVACTLRNALDMYGKPTVAMERKITRSELRALHNYIK